MSNRETVILLINGLVTAQFPAQVRSRMAEDFSFDSGLEWLDLHGFASMIEMASPWSELDVIECIDDESLVYAMFEAIEGITGLKRRMAWLARFVDGRLHTLIEAGTIVRARVDALDP